MREWHENNSIILSVKGLHVAIRYDQSPTMKYTIDKFTRG